VFDKRGTGLSDPVAIDALPTIEEWIDDLRAVLDAIGSPRTVLLTGTGAAYMAPVFAATYSERTSALVMVDPSARLAWAPDNPWRRRVENLPGELRQLADSWGTAGRTMNFMARGLLDDHLLMEQFELIGSDVAGIAVHIAARICALAGAREVLASSTVKDLVAGSGISFKPRRSRRLRGVPGSWAIFEAMD
jgi:pimeloyl-ACP methyl ester carboxylesterase